MLLKEERERWNRADRLGSPGFGALYLNASLDVARANARRHAQESFGVSIDDLVDERLPDLQHYEVVSADFVDAVTPCAIAALGLPLAYPAAIARAACQEIAEVAYAQSEHGIAPLSAVLPADEELVVFDRDVTSLTRKGERAPFTRWY